MTPDRCSPRSMPLIPTMSGARPTPGDLARCVTLQTTYADLRLGVVDASVFALVERLGEPKVATLDHRHFATVRPAHVHALHLLP